VSSYTAVAISFISDAAFFASRREDRNRLNLALPTILVSAGNAAAGAAAALASRATAGASRKRYSLQRQSCGPYPPPHVPLALRTLSSVP